MTINTTTQEYIQNALKEDIGEGDITTESLISPTTQAEAHIICKQEAIVAGQEIAAYVFSSVSPQVRYQIKKSDGERVDNQGVIAVINGSVANILKGERLALNYLQRLSGVATTTHAFVQAVKPYGANILDTRKTTPLLRSLEKKAVLAGGGVNHRYGLYDQVLIKENHLQAVCEQEHMALDEAIPFAIKMSRQGVDDIVEIEVQTLDQAMSAVKAGADIVLLDNMSCADMARVVKDVRHRLKNKVLLEASGGISLDTVNTVAATGVDRISVGALTHSCEAVDYSLLFNV